MNDLKMSIRGTCIKSGNFSLTSWTLLVSKIPINKRFSKTLPLFDFQSICVHQETFNGTKTATWIGKHFPISIWNSSSIRTEPNFRCNSDPQHLVASLLGTLEGLSLQSKTQMKFLYRDIAATLNAKLGNILKKLAQQRNRRKELRRFCMSQDESENENCASTQFLQIRKILQMMSETL